MTINLMKTIKDEIKLLNLPKVYSAINLKLLNK